MSINSVVNDTVTGESVVNALKPKPPTITGYSISGADDTALDPAGGQTILLNGTGFQRGATVTLNGTAVSVVTYVDANQLSFTSPAVSAGTYTIYAVNADGGTGIYIPGLIYSNLPTWTTSAGTLGSYYETQTIASNVVASGDAPVTYSLFSGALPAGAVFNANGTISGSAPADSGSTTYSFTVRATDAQLQDSNRSFSLTINTDVVSWITPNASATYTPTVNSVMANIGLTATSAAGSAVTYSANSLPTGVSLSGNTISGTPSVVSSSSTLLTATATATSRSATRTINWAIAVASDNYFGYNTLLLPGASTTFVKDASSNNFAVTVNGDTKPNSFNPYTPGYYSNYFDSSSAISLPTTQTTTGSFTAECWFYRSADPVNYHVIFGGSDIGSGGTVNTQLSVRPTGAVGFVINAANGAAESATGVVPLGQWSHIVWVRSGTSCATFVNGSRVATGTSSGTLEIKMIGSGGNGAGAIFAPSYSSVGYISNARITTIAVYDPAQTTLTVPTSPLTAITGTTVLTCQSNRLIDNSTNAYVLTALGAPQIKSFQPFIPNNSYSTYGSGYFDGTGDYLITPTDTAFTFGTGDFTIECWVYLTNSSATTQTIMGADLSVSTGSIQVWYNNTANKITFNVYGNPQFVSSSTVSVGNWIHLAFTRSSGTFNMFINGTQSASGSMTNNLPNNKFVIGRGYATIDAEYSYGYISDVRVVKGTAVYTTAFTPPTSPLTAIANTSLLTLQNNQPTNNSVFLDNSTNNFFVTRNGNATQGSFSPYGGNWSNYFDGTGDYLYISDNSEFALGSSNFTMEAWIYPTATGNFPVIASQYQTGSTSFFWSLGPTATPRDASFYLYYSGGNTLLSASNAVVLNTWAHHAVVRNSNTLTYYINGVSVATAAFSNTVNDSAAFVTIGNGGDANYTTYPFAGYISNLRIVKGTAVYTSSFTPSTTPLTAISNTILLTCADNQFIDDSINNFTVTKAGDTSVQRFSPFSPASLTPASYSAYFDGTGDYLTVPASASLAPLTGDFTYECWVYPTSSTLTYRAIFGIDNYGGGQPFRFYQYGTNFQFWYTGSGSDFIGSSTITVNTWYHIAVTRSSGVIKLFVNGIQAGSNVTSTLNYPSSIFRIGMDLAGSYPFVGYVSNLRAVVGTAVYTSNFTPSTTPLTAITNTQLLTLQSTSFVDNSSNNFAISATGDAKPTQQNPFGYTSATTTGYTASTTGGSAYFDGSGDYITVPNDTNINLGSANFTIEMWVYITSSAGNFTLFQKPSSYELKVDSSRWVWQINANNNIFVTNGTLANNTWTHVAMVRNGATSTLYLNGAAYTSGGSADASSNGNALIVGSGSAAFGGYISDFRIIKGTAVYKSNFLPPAAPLTAVQNTVLLANMTSAGVHDAAMQNNLETVGDARLSTAVTKFGGSSMYFDGTGDYCFIPNTQAFLFGSRDFTIELWAYIGDTSTRKYILGPGTDTNTHYDGFGLEIWNQQLSMWASSNGTSWDMIECDTAGNRGATLLAANTWYHIAVTRSGNTFRSFVNGVVEKTFTVSGSIFSDVTIPYNIGRTAYQGGNFYYNGYIDDLRITRGYARYTANFTPPTEAFMTK